MLKEIEAEGKGKIVTCACFDLNCVVRNTKNSGTGSPTKIHQYRSDTVDCANDISRDRQVVAGCRQDSRPFRFP